jgi:hypothetical protein
MKEALENFRKQDPDTSKYDLQEFEIGKNIYN